MVQATAYLPRLASPRKCGTKMATTRLAAHVTGWVESKESPPRRTLVESEARGAAGALSGTSVSTVSKCGGAIAVGDGMGIDGLRSGVCPNDVAAPFPGG